MCSTVVNQWVSKITSVSPLTASIAWRSLPKPSTMLVSTPPPIRSRIGFGAMTPGWWLTTAAPTISPIAGSLVDERVLADRDVLDVAVKVETPRPALPADAGIARPAERGPELADEEAVHPHRTGNDARGDAHGPILVAGEQGGREAVLGGVGDLDHLVVAAESVPGEDGAEHLLLEDLLVPARAGDHGRLEVKLTLIVSLAAPEDLDAFPAGPVDEPLHAFEMLGMDQRTYSGRRVARIAHGHAGDGLAHLAEERVGDLVLHEHARSGQADLARIDVLP